jgi:hypothetical protein
MVARAGAIAGEIGRADRLVRFLRVLGLGLVVARLLGHVARIVALDDRSARRRIAASGAICTPSVRM